jgi:hypothetical protein
LSLKRAVREQQSLFNATVALIEDKASGTQLSGLHGILRGGRFSYDRSSAERLSVLLCLVLFEHPERLLGLRKK